MAPRASSPRRKASRRKHSKLKNLLVAHEGNGFHPHIFRPAAIAVFILAIVLFEGAYIYDTDIAQNHEGFLASVLPGALFDLTNADRSTNGVAPLTRDPALDQAAQLKANDMAAKGYFAHVSPEGKTPWYWLDQVGYQYTYAGENLAINFDDSNAVETAWMNSPTHRANIVKPQYTRVGYAVAQGMYQGRETTFVVQEFAAKPADETVTATPKQENAMSAVAQKVASVVKPKTAEQPEKVTVAGPAAQTPEVAGAESSQKAQTQSAQAAPTNTGQPMILASHDAERITNASPVSFFARLAASPRHTSIYFLGGLSILVLFLLGVALASHARVRYLEVLGAGLLIIIFSISVLLYNVAHTPTPILTGQAAAVTAQ